MRAHTCNCTNQCPGCGSCCQIACGCQRRTGTWTTPWTPYSPPAQPLTPQVPLPPGTIKFIPTAPALTEERVREIIREEIAAGFQAERERDADVKEDGRA